MVRTGVFIGVTMRILAVDLEHIFWSLALGGASPQSLTSIVTTEIRTLAKGARDLPGYDRVAISVGARAPSFRQAFWPSYKADRKSRPDNLWGLLADAIKACESEGWAVLRMPEEPEGMVEADDGLATIATWAANNGHTCDIFTGDSDLCQMVNDARGIRLLRRYKGQTMLDEAGVLAWMGHRAGEVAWVKMLAGDIGDGYGNVFPGIGEKGAIAALRKYGTPEGVIEAARLACELHGDKAPSMSKTLWAGGRGPELLRVAGILARTRADIPLDLESILVARAAKPLPAFGADMLPEINLDADDPNDAPTDPRSDRAMHSADDARAVAEFVAAPSRPAATSSALAIVDTSARLLLPANESRNRIAELVAWVRSCLTPGVDYGTIPGCGDKPVLFKPGAEKMAEVYGLAASFLTVKEVERWGDEGEPFFYYAFRCMLARKSDGIQVSEAIGSCNSKETKYGGRWLKEHSVPAHLDVKRLKKKEFTSRFGADKGQIVVQYRCPNEEIFDQVNAIQKMAEKRAFVAAVLRATRSGGLFSQDLEDVPAEAYGRANDAPQWDL
ncbi:MAG: hypothetical protein WCJ30_15665 [Deltaproteobacteria bacterium]